MREVSILEPLTLTGRRKVAHKRTLFERLNKQDQL